MTTQTEALVAYVTAVCEYDASVETLAAIGGSARFRAVSESARRAQELRPVDAYDAHAVVCADLARARQSAAAAIRQ